MASLADKNLPQAAQDEINRITAQAQAGQISWSDANAAANKVRQDNGANFTVSAGGTTTFDDNSTISSYKTGSQTSGGKAQSFVDDWNNNATVSTNNNDYYGGHVGLNADMSRNKNLAGMSVKQGQYTVTYDKNGYAVKAKKDGGVSATGYAPAPHANDSAWHQAAYQAAQMGDWDLVGQYLNKISETYGQTGGDMNLKAANLYQGELQNRFGYDDETYYNKRYDEAYGPNAAAVWDATGGAIKTYADLVNAVGTERAQQMVQNQIAKNPGVYNNSGSWVGGVNNAPSAGAQAPSVLVGGAVQGGGSYPTGGYNYGYTGGFGVNDMTQYLKDMFAQDLEAQLAGLASGYEQSAAEIRAHDDIINNQYQQAMNQAAAQNDLERLYMNEMGIMNGLNTGATGQLALGQSMAYQGNLANLGAAQAQDLAANNRLLSQLTSQYNNAVAQATANTNSALNNALYQEMLRQEEIAREEALAQQKLAQQAQATAREEALTLLANGVTPNPAMLNAANMTAEEAALWLQLATGSASNSTTTQDYVGSPRVPGPGYNNGGLTTAQVMAAQRYYGTTDDGLWGANSANAANGMTAEQAWETAILPQIERNIGMNRTATGQLSAIEQLTNSGEITEAQAWKLIEKFGLNG